MRVGVGAEVDVIEVARVLVVEEHAAISMVARVFARIGLKGMGIHNLELWTRSYEPGWEMEL